MTAAIPGVRLHKSWPIFLLAITVFAGLQLAHAQTYDLVYTFMNSANGSGPNGELVQDSDGNFYGTTRSGGASSSSSGTIFKLDTSGVETVLYSFTNGTDGSVPSSGLFRDPDGNLYGTAQFGGAAKCTCGTIFKLDPDNVLTTLHSFRQGSDGAFPRSTRLVSVNGVLYGTTSGGGTSSAGVIFSVTKAGKEKVVYTFTGRADGDIPNDLVRDTAGNLYGTTFSSSPGRGTIFKLDTSSHFSTLYTFTGGTDGADPMGRLIIDATASSTARRQKAGIPTVTAELFSAWIQRATRKSWKLFTPAPAGTARRTASWMSAASSTARLLSAATRTATGTVDAEPFSALAKPGSSRCFTPSQATPK